VLEAGVDPLGAGEILVEVLKLACPELGLDAAEATLGPFCGDEGIDEHKLRGVRWLMMLEECGLEGFELGEVFAANDVRDGVDAGLQSILRAGGFAFGGFGAGRFLGVLSIGVDLCLG
jgi:hypothetical protein